ncbi:MAG: 4Fe-4S binding protein [Parabacteroides sp.]
MQYNSVHLVYFSPTHTSAKIAYSIVEGMNLTTFAEWDLTYEDPEEAFLEDELTVVAVPVYGGRVAETAVERLRNFKADHAPVVPVVVYGNRDYEDALLELCDLLKAKGFVPVAAAAFIGEHSFSRPTMPVAAGRPDEEDVKQAMAFGKSVKEKLSHITAAEELAPLQVKGHFPYRVKTPSKPQAPVTDAILCTQCEYCIDVCPVGAISLAEDGMDSDPLKCIKCCACVKECPEGARSFDTPYTPILYKNCQTRREPEIFI